MTDGDRPHAGPVERPRDRLDLVDAVLVRDRVRAVAQRRVDDPDRSLIAPTPACSSATRTAAAVMMSRLPANGGRLSPAPSTSTISVTTPSAISGAIFSR